MKMDAMLDGLVITFPNDETATWLTRVQIQLLMRDGSLTIDGKTITVEDGPFRVRAEEDQPS